MRTCWRHVAAGHDGARPPLPVVCGLGLGPSWVLLDGCFAEVALFDRTQPEGLALATYLTAVSAVANTIVVPGHAVVQRRVQWSLRTWVGGAVYAQLATALVLAAFWHKRVGGASVALYLCVFATSLVGNFQQLALNPWAAETGRATRIVELMAGGNAARCSRPSSRSCSASIRSEETSARRRSSSASRRS